MSLTKAQKKYLKKNLKRFTLAKIASDLNVSEEEIHKFLKSHWRKEKYQKFLDKERSAHLRGEAKLKPQEHLGGEWLKKNWKVLAFLAFLVFFVYFNSLGNDFVSDDIYAIKNDPHIGQISYFWKPPYSNINLRLLVIFLTHKIFGLNPIFYRLSNILFHLGSSFTIFFLIGLFSSSPIPFMTASIFAVHPVLTEAVTWISGGAHAQYSFFFLASLVLYVLARKSDWPKKIYFSSIFVFFIALFSSEKAVVFPLVLLFLSVSYGKLTKTWKRLIPFFSLSALWTLLFIFGGRILERVAILQTQYYQKPGLENSLIQIPIAISSYLELIFWPKNLTLYHSEMIFSQGEYFARLLGFVLFLATIVYFFKKERRLFFWLLFFFISLLPTLTPLRISWVVAERYVYLGSVGIFILVALGIQKIAQVSKNKEVAYGLLALILLALSIRTIIRNADWKNQDTLWLATAKTSPSSPQNHNNLGDLYARQGNFEKAIEEFKIAIELKPNYGDAYHNLANTYHQVGEEGQAIQNYQKALNFNPNLWQSYQNLAAIYFEKEEFGLAEENLKKAIAVNSQNANLYTNLGVIYFKLEEKEKAEAEFQKALQLDPQNERARKGLLSL